MTPSAATPAPRIMAEVFRPWAPMIGTLAGMPAWSRCLKVSTASWAGGLRQGIHLDGLAAQGRSDERDHGGIVAGASHQRGDARHVGPAIADLEVQDVPVDAPPRVDLGGGKEHALQNGGAIDTAGPA